MDPFEDDISYQSQDSDRDFISYEEESDSDSDSDSDPEDIIFPEIKNPQWKEVKRSTSNWLKEYEEISGPRNLEFTEKSPPIQFFHLIFPISLFVKIKE